MPFFTDYFLYLPILCCQCSHVFEEFGRPALSIIIVVINGKDKSSFKIFVYDSLVYSLLYLLQFLTKLSLASSSIPNTPQSVVEIENKIEDWYDDDDDDREKQPSTSSSSDKNPSSANSRSVIE